MNQGGNYWTLFTPGIWKVLHAVLHIDDLDDLSGCSQPGAISPLYLNLG
jgi:hypothetical protein